MGIQRKIRYFVILVSLIMFCYQLNTALQHLMDEGTVDSTDVISISDLEAPPVVTFCPRQGAWYEKLAELGYSNVYNLMQGTAEYKS